MMINVLIAEDFPSHNKGEAALFFGIKESLRPLGDVRLSLFSLYPDIDRPHYAGEADVVDARGVTPAHMLDSQGGRAAKLYNYLNFMAKHLFFGLFYGVLGSGAFYLMRSPVWKAYADADLILMAHDSSHTPLYHGCQALLFRVMGKTSMVYGATIKRKTRDRTSLKARLMDAWVAFTSKKITNITLREGLSREYLAEIGVTEEDVPIKVYPDLAFIIPPSERSEVKDILTREGVPEDKPLIGVAISQRKLDFAFPGQALPDRRERALASFIALADYVTGTLDATVVFIPHSIGPTPILDDRVTADMIRAKCRDPERLIIIRNDYTPNQLKGLAACLDMTIGTRLHFTIDAVCSAVPSMLVTHDGDLRCHGIIGEMLGMRDYVYNIDAIDHDSLIRMADKLWRQRDEVRAYLSRIMETIKRDTYRHGEDALRLITRSDDRKEKKTA